MSKSLKQISRSLNTHPLALSFRKPLTNIAEKGRLEARGLIRPYICCVGSSLRTRLSLRTPQRLREAPRLLQACARQESQSQEPASMLSAKAGPGKALFKLPRSPLYFNLR